MESSNSQSSSRALRREVLLYLAFGVLTTFVAMAANFGILWGARLFTDLSDTASPKYLAVYSLAKAVSWACAVLFAFFTNKKWVFRDKTTERSSVLRQLAVFAGGRLLTLGMDYAVNYLLLLAFAALPLAFLDGFLGLSRESIVELGAWGVTQVFVVIANYFLSKWLVFRKKRSE